MKVCLKRKFTDNIKATPRQAADDIIVEALYYKDMTWDDVHTVVDSVIEEKVKYCKHKMQNKANPFGHSFEAVGELWSRLIEKDPYLLYKTNNRNMEEEPAILVSTAISTEHLNVVLGLLHLVHTYI